MRLLGTPSINRWLFIAGKICFGVSLGFFAAAGLGFDGSIVVVPALRPIASALAGASLLVLVLSFVHLGRSLRMGLPQEPTKLKTAGIYRLSRNPMYLSLFLLCVASSLYVINPLNILSTLAAILIHHRIVLAEERFLQQTFGDAFRDYRARVRRYV
jgi:protein-S-isoprenylcysteine O-methyltransferase Ste14